MKVSIVVPVYNVEKYLEKCLESLVAQTLDEYEIIVVNDGTQDSSGMIIEEYVNRYPELIKSFTKNNGGLSDARNYGLKFCSGEYIGFLDSDDYVDSEMYRTMYEKAIEEKSDLVICDYYKVYGDKKVLVHANAYYEKTEMFIGALAAAWNKLYKKSLLMNSGVVFPKGLIYEDTAFFCELIPYVDKVSYIAKPFVYYLQRVGSIANSQGEKTAQIFGVFEHIIDFYNRSGFRNMYSKELEYYCIRIAFGSNLERVCRIDDAKLRKKMLLNTVMKAEQLFPEYRKNKYILEETCGRHFLIRIISKRNIYYIAIVMRCIFKRKDRKLLR